MLSPITRKFKRDFLRTIISVLRNIDGIIQLWLQIARTHVHYIALSSSHSQLFLICTHLMFLQPMILKPCTQATVFLPELRFLQITHPFLINVFSLRACYEPKFWKHFLFIGRHTIFKEWFSTHLITWRRDHGKFFIKDVLISGGATSLLKTGRLSAQWAASSRGLTVSIPGGKYIMFVLLLTRNRKKLKKRPKRNSPTIS